MKAPPIIASQQILSKEIALIEALGEVEIATSIDKKAQHLQNNMHLSDWRYSQLHSSIAVESEPQIMTAISKSISSTHGATHNSYSIEIKRCFRINRDGETARFAPHAQEENRQILFHGSRMSNFVGIISQGLRIAPPEA